MRVKFTIKNYRCFSDQNPAILEIRNGITSFVGINNAGKSTVLKFFYEFRDLFKQLENPGHIAAAINSSQHFRKAEETTDIAEIFHNANNRGIEIFMEILEKNALFASGEIMSGRVRISKIQITVLRDTSRFSIKTYQEDGQEIHIKDAATFSENTYIYSRGSAITDIKEWCELSKILSNTLYIGPFRNLLNVGTKNNYYDIQVGQAFIEHWRQSTTGTSKASHGPAYKLRQDIKHIFGFNELEINASANGETLQILINGHTYWLSEIGSGLPHFILVLMYVAFRNPQFILIDEPELNLHPSLQLDFITTLTSYAQSGILFSTHSIGLARAASDNIYSVQRKTKESYSELHEIEESPRLSELLGELSFSGYRDLGFSKVLLVEGTSDVKTLQQFLKKYLKDHEILLLPLGGGSLINSSSEDQLAEITRISNNIFAVIDSERSQKGEKIAKDRFDFERICKKLKINCHILEKRATENYFTDVAIKQVLGSEYGALGDFEKLKGKNPGWSKKDNWRIAREMKKEDLSGTDLGDFIENQLLS